MAHTIDGRRLSSALAEPQVLDGRRARALATRDRIVEAMLRLVREGDVSPSAARVAQTAGVGMRTVFRHFDEMDALYREMAERIEARVMPVLLKPFAATEWRARLSEMVDRRALIFETIMPYRLSADMKRFQSDFLMRGHLRQARLERAALHAALPAYVAADAARVAALELALSFDCWRRLRHEQGLSPDQAQRAMRLLVEALLAGVSAD